LDQPSRKTLIIGLRLGRAASLAYKLSAAGLSVWVASADAEELALLRTDDRIFVHRMFANRIASVHEVFESIDAQPGNLEFVLFEAGDTEVERDAERTIASSIRTALLPVISQSIRRMTMLGRGWITVHNSQPSRRNSWFAPFFAGQTLEKMVEGAVSEVSASGVKIEYLSTAESLGEIGYLNHLSRAGAIADGFDELPDLSIFQFLP
jgi:hypothetical protein